ncbi:hypothetical protein MNBD_GAMMA07-919 [hydrothermal vent metagenome]|uniref:VWFA domain-containing protein n=1 Tax=hydrothermal vent metagenome TaxID=652676 RepID=A0A3B0WTU6_9ZZZZ
MINFFNQIYWREPLWLLLVLYPWLLMGWKIVCQQKGLKRYADAHLLPWVVVAEFQYKYYGKNSLQVLIWLFFAVAAAGPRILISAPNDILPSAGAAIVVVDHSRSMNANDVFPSRLQLANNMVKQWSLQNNNLQLGLVIFSGASHVVLPATSDKKAFHEVTQLLNNIQLPTHGSAFVQALNQAQDLLIHKQGERAIIMLSDGDLSEPEFIEINNTVAELKLNNISLQLLGVGSLSSTALMDAPGHWLEHKGKAVLTQLKETELKRLASSHDNVNYMRLDPDVHVKLSIVWPLPKARISTENQIKAIWQEIFSWPLLAAMVLISLTQLSVPKRWFKSMMHSIIFFAVTLILMSQSQLVYAEAKTLQQAYQLWGNKNYAQAAKAYATIAGYDARMGEGASCFREDDIECAISAFSRAAWVAELNVQRGKAAFNLANSFFKQGDFKSAINSYKDALRYQPEQAAYSNNLKFSLEVQKNIERHERLLANRKNSRRTAGSGDIEANINFDNQRVSTLDARISDSPRRTKLNDNSDIALTLEQLALYMQRYQRYAQLSSKTKHIGLTIMPNKQPRDWSRFSNDTPEAENILAFWQRLFELEENIPAHRDQPKNLPGVDPW